MDENSIADRLANIGLHFVYVAGQRAVAWRYWGLYSQPDLVSAIADQMLTRLSGVIPSIDYLCAVPRSGFVLGGHLQARLNMPMITFYFDHDSVHGPSLVQPSKKVMLVDTAVNTGATLESASNMLRTIDAELSHACVWVLNDMYPKGLVRKGVRDLLRQKKLTSLYRVSQLVPFWEERGEIAD